MTSPQFPAGTKHLKVVKPEAIAASADAEAKRLSQTARWRRAYGSAVGMTPLLVLGPTGSKRNYYIVEFRSSGRSTGRMIFNAIDGVLGQTAGLRVGQEALGRFAMPTEMPPLVDHRDVTYPDGAIITLIGAQFSVEADLVWTSCDQSHSPFQPFYVVRQPPRVAYVRIDGQVYSQLTITAGGA